MGAHTSLNGYTSDANGNSQPSSTSFGLAAADETSIADSDTRGTNDMVGTSLLVRA